MPVRRIDEALCVYSSIDERDVWELSSPLAVKEERTDRQTRRIFERRCLSHPPTLYFATKGGVANCVGLPSGAWQGATMRGVTVAGKAIRALRKTRGWTQEVLAVRSGCDVMTILAAEKSKRPPQGDLPRQWPGDPCFGDVGVRGRQRPNRVLRCLSEIRSDGRDFLSRWQSRRVGRASFSATSRKLPCLSPFLAARIG